MTDNSGGQAPAGPAEVTDADRALAAAGPESLQALKAEFAQQRRLRQDAERASRNADAFRKALLALARERDALSSERLDRVRDRAEHLLVRLQAAWDQADGIRMNAAELARRGLDVLDGETMVGTGFASAEAADRAARERVEEMLAAAGLQHRVRVPVPPNASAPADRQAELDAMLAESDAHFAESERGRARLRRGAGRDRNAATQRRPDRSV